MKKVLTEIREFFWPLLEKPEDASNAASEQEPIIVVGDDHIEEAYKLHVKITESEEERRKGIESKAALFLSSISIVTSLIIAANTLIIGNEVYELPIKISIVITFILTVYALRTVWFSIKALEKAAFKVLAIEDINKAGKKTEYYSHLIKKHLEIYRQNQSAINSKVDHFTMAQEYYKRAIVVISIYSFFILLFCFFYKKDSDNTKIYKFDKIEIINPLTKDTLQIDTSAISIGKSSDTGLIKSSKIKIEQKKNKTSSP